VGNRLDVERKVPTLCVSIHITRPLPFITDLLSRSPPYDWWCDPPYGVFAGFYDIPREWLRSLRKKLGLAASWEVAGLASVLRPLHEQTQTLLEAKGFSADAARAAVITTSDLVGLYDEDVHDLAIYLGLTATTVPGPPKVPSYPFASDLLVDWRFQRQPKHIDVAQLAYGFGICGNTSSTAACEEEEQIIRETLGSRRNLLSVHASRRGLELNFQYGRTILYTQILGCQQHVSYFNSSLGLDDLERLPGDTYWPLLRDLVGRIIYTANVTDVFMLGDLERLGQNREVFKQKVVQAIMGPGSNNQIERPVVYDRSDRLLQFQAAEGAARMAQRILGAPVDYGYPGGVEGSPRCQP